MVPTSERASTQSALEAQRLRRAIIDSLNKRYATRLTEIEIAELADAPIADLDEVPVKNFVPILAMRHAHRAAARLAA